MLFFEDYKTLLGVIGTTVVSYNIIIRVRDYLKQNENPFVPIGTIKELYIYPGKSCKSKKVFSFYCHPNGPISGENNDRHFLVMNGHSGRVYAASQKPKLVLIDVNVENGNLVVKIPNENEIRLNLEEIKKKKEMRTSTFYDRLRTDGYDCGDELSKLLSNFIEEPNARMVYYTDDVFTERNYTTKDKWWENNKVPKRNVKVAYAALAPYMIQTEASLTALNSRLREQDKALQINFRPNIVIDYCPAWDEDKFEDLRIGKAQLQCFMPCARCLLTTVNTETGIKNPSMEPLKELRKFRLAPEGKMRKEFKDSPIFGVYAGVEKEDYIHVGQVVYGRYKKCAF